jgi:hypothetical protein
VFTLLQKARKLCFTISIPEEIAEHTCARKGEVHDPYPSLPKYSSVEKGTLKDTTNSVRGSYLIKNLQMLLLFISLA